MHNENTCPTCQYKTLIDNLRGTPLWERLVRQPDDEFNEVDIVIAEMEGE